MKINFKLILYFNIMILFKLLFIGFLTIFVSCEDAVYKFDNSNDPLNMNLDPPALFFHPSEIETFINTSDSVEIYGFRLDSTAAAHIEIVYEYGSIDIDSISPGPFFTNTNEPIEIMIMEGNKIQIYIFYLPNMESDQNIGGTWPLAKIYFSTRGVAGTYGLDFGPNTKLRDAKNSSVRINTFGRGSINVVQ